MGKTDIYKFESSFGNDLTKHLFELLLWYGCNANCVFCSNHPEWRTVDWSTIGDRTKNALKQIYEARKAGYKILGLSGGEPTIYPDIFKILNFAKKVGFETIRIQTNALMMSDFKFCQKIVDAGASFIKFSIHGHKAELHDKLTRVPGSYQMVLNTLDNLNELEVATEINFVVNKANYKFIPQFVVSMFNRNISKFVIIFPTYDGRMKADHQKWGVKLTEVAPYIFEAIDIVKALELDKLIVMNMPFCVMRGYESYCSGVLSQQIRVSTPDGESENSPQDNFYLSKYKISACQKCTFNNRCGGLLEDYANIYGLSELKPVKVDS